MGGTRLIKLVIIIASMFLLTGKGNSQEIGISAMTYISPGYNFVLDPGMNGAGFSVFYNGQKHRRLNLSISGEYAMSTWGHQALLGIGINRTWLEWERFSLTTYGHFLSGLALYEPQSLYVFGVDTRISANYYLNYNLKVFLGVGAKYTLCPAYRKYGLIETSLDIPIELGMKYAFKLVNYGRGKSRY